MAHGDGGPDAIDAGLSNLLDRVRSSSRGKLPLKVRTLLETCGYRAENRVRRASLDAVLARLTQAGLTHVFPSGSRAGDDYITLSLQSASTGLEGGDTNHEPAVPVEGIESSVPWSGLMDPIRSTFVVEEDRFGGFHDVVNRAAWAFHPVCVFVSGSETEFAVAAAYFGALLRRRATLIRFDGEWGIVPQAPVITSSGGLRDLIGAHGAEGKSPFAWGAFLLVRQSEHESEDRELPGLIHELYTPHTYRLRSREAPGENGTAPRFSERADFSAVQSWLQALSASSQPLDLEHAQLASAVAEAVQARDLSFELAAEGSSVSGISAGAESTEHLVLKNLAASVLVERFSEREVQVEKGVEFEGAEGPEKARPDVLVPQHICVEVETLRGLGGRGNSPFFALEAKLRRKLAVMETCEEAWLLIPSDLLMLAAPQLLAVARNLRSAAKGVRIRLGYQTLPEGHLAFLDDGPRGSPRVQVTGNPWRTAAAGGEEGVTIEDVAGYEAFKSRIREEVLDPITFGQEDEKYGLRPPAGLLLYGLPGCGKTLMGRVIAGQVDRPYRVVYPSDLTSQWLGRGTEKIRELFDWAIQQQKCVLILDEIDAVAPKRSEENMHSDEKRQVNELLAQLDRIAGKPITVIATTNYLRGIDSAVRRSGRFDQRIPVFPPNEADRSALFRYYLHPKRAERPLPGAEEVDLQTLAHCTPLFVPADIRTLTHKTIRRCLRHARAGEDPKITTLDLLGTLPTISRSLKVEEVRAWSDEARQELGPSEDLERLERECIEVLKRT